MCVMTCNSHLMNEFVYRSDSLSEWHCVVSHLVRAELQQRGIK